MSYIQRKAWTRDGGGALCCQPCQVKARLQQLQYERDRQKFAAVKEVACE